MTKSLFEFQLVFELNEMQKEKSHKFYALQSTCMYLHLLRSIHTHSNSHIKRMRDNEFNIYFIHTIADYFILSYSNWEMYWESLLCSEQCSTECECLCVFHAVSDANFNWNVTMSRFLDLRFYCKTLNEQQQSNNSSFHIRKAFEISVSNFIINMSWKLW